MHLLSLERGPLAEHVAALWNDPDTTTTRPEWPQVMEVIAEALGAKGCSVEPFIQAWRQLYSTTLLLDHLQDGDELDPAWFARLPQPLQYHLVFGAYALSQKAVSGPYHDIPEHRVTRLLQFWSLSITLIAEGQYQDLTGTIAASVTDGRSPLDMYEEIIALKAGALFALGFGGVAILATDDEECIDAAINAGKIFGMLLQYGDDLLDVERQRSQSSTLTLPRALRAAFPAADEHRSAQLTWAFVYASYLQSLCSILAPLPTLARDAVHGLVRDTFGTPPAPIVQVVKGIDEPRDKP